MFRASRERRDDADRFLDLKIALFLVGAVVGVAGMVRQNRTFITIAMVIVAIGFLLRFVGRKRPAEDEEPPPP